MRTPQIAFPVLVQDFFLRRLVAQRGASARTVEAYRDGFELLLGYLEQRTGKPPSALCLADLDAPLVLDFLDHLETERGNSIRTRNARLAAIHSFMRYAALRDPASLAVTARVLAIPAKRFDRPVLGYLTREQVTAILAAPDRRTWSGRRDAVLLATAYTRVSELCGEGVAGPGVVGDLSGWGLAWRYGRKSGGEELAAEPGEHVGGAGLGLGGVPRA